MDLGDSLYLAFAKKIRMLYNCYHLVTHCYCSKLPRSSSNLVEKTAMLCDMARMFSTIFFKSAKINLSPKSNDRLQILFCNSNLLIQRVWFLMELGFAGFFHYHKISSTMWFLWRQSLLIVLFALLNYSTKFVLSST